MPITVLTSAYPRHCPRPWLLEESLPVRLAVGTCSGHGAGEHIRGHFVPAPSLAMNVGWSTLPGACGVHASRAEKGWPRHQCLLAPACQPTFAGSTSRQFHDLPVRTPIHLCSRRRQMRLLASPLSCPLHGLRTSRYREACASAPHQGRSESHRHQKQVLELSSNTALSFGTNPPDLIQGRFPVNESHLHCFVRRFFATGAGMPYLLAGNPVLRASRMASQDHATRLDYLPGQAQACRLKLLVRPRQNRQLYMFGL